jgi:hypothetical protein
MQHFDSSRRALSALPGFSCMVLLAATCHNLSARAPDIPIGATYVCNGEHIYIESCNIRDLSDTANCMVAHPDHLTPAGMNSYTYASRGALKKLLPSCQRPSAKQMAAAKAFQQKQQDVYDANVQKANNRLDQNLRANAQADAARTQTLTAASPATRTMDTRYLHREALPAPRSIFHRKAQAPAFRPCRPTF